MTLGLQQPYSFWDSVARPSPLISEPEEHEGVNNVEEPKPMTPIPPSANDGQRKVETIIFSTSITKGIKVREVNDKIDDDGLVSIRRFHGAKAAHVKEYLWVHLRDVRPKTAVIQTGGNDLPTPRFNPVPVATIAADVIESGLICRGYGVKNVFISGVPIRRKYYLQNRCAELNTILRELCKLHDFTFIDNSAIKLEHLQNDGVHLADEGSNILRDNYIHFLNSAYWDNIIATYC